MSSTEGASWRPSPYRAAGYAVGAGVAVLMAALTERGPVDLEGGLPLLVVAGVLLALAGLDLWFGEVLRVDHEGLTLSHGPRRQERLPWSEIERLEATSTTSRAVLRLSSLEIDLGTRLIVLSRHRLGADPEVVADELRRRRPS